MARRKQPDLEGFRRWLIDRGRADETASVYAYNVRSCLHARGGYRNRLFRETLAPATRRVNVAALRAWARFAGDESLLGELEDLRLEPPAPVVEKEPLSFEQWIKFDECLPVLEDPVLRAAAEMVSIRGFRVGALPSLQRRQVMAALRSGTLSFVSKRRPQTYTAEPFRHCLEAFAAARSRWNVLADLLSPTTAPERRHAAARQRLRRAICRVASEAGIEGMHPHRLRRTYAEAYYDEVRDLVRLRDHMAWNSIETAARYVTRDRRAELDKIADRMRKKRSSAA